MSRPYYVSVGPDGSGDVTDVETCGQWVAVSFDNVISPLNGRVMIYTSYNAEANPPMQLLYEFAGEKISWDLFLTSGVK